MRPWPIQAGTASRTGLAIAEQEEAARWGRLVCCLWRECEQATAEAKSAISGPELRPVEGGLAEPDLGIPGAGPALRDPGVGIRQDLRHLSGTCGNDALALGSRGEEARRSYAALASALHGFGLHVQASTYSVW